MERSVWSSKKKQCSKWVKQGEKRSRLRQFKYTDRGGLLISRSTQSTIVGHLRPRRVRGPLPTTNIIALRQHSYFSLGAAPTSREGWAHRVFSILTDEREILVSNLDIVIKIFLVTTGRRPLHARRRNWYLQATNSINWQVQHVCESHCSWHFEWWISAHGISSTYRGVYQLAGIQRVCESLLMTFWICFFFLSAQTLCHADCTHCRSVFFCNIFFLRS
jgi:hypothetical protein